MTGRLRFLGACAALAATVALAPAASAVVVRQPGGHFLGVATRAGVSSAAIRGSLAAERAAPRAAGPGVLSYHGGPVLHSSSPYLVFWTPSGESTPSPRSQALMARYFSDVAADSGGSSNVFGVARQFTDGGGFADYRQTFNPVTQAMVDTDPFPGNGCSETGPTFPRCLTDAQLQGELSHLIGSRGLPTGIGPNAPIYFLVTPADVNVCLDSADCADVQFCAYHSAMSAAAGAPVLYAAIPFFINGASSFQDPKSCQHDGISSTQEPNGDLADVAISYMSHEDNEAITDPIGTGWFSDASGFENGDECAGVDVNPDAFQPTLSPGVDQLINGHPYYTQSEWSNGDGTCEMRSAPGSVAPSFTVPPPGSTPRGASATFDAGASTSTNAITSVTWSFGDGSPPAVLSGAFAFVPATHAYSAAGRYGVTLTLVDDRGNVSRSTEQIVVGSKPAARIKLSKSRPAQGARVRFDATSSNDPDPGIPITAYRWSFGDGRSASGTTATHSYRRAGTYTVRLTATNSLGLSASSTRRVTVIGITRIRVIHKRRTSATLLVTVNAAGRVFIGRQAHRFKRPGTTRLTVTLTSAQTAALRRSRRHALTVHVRVHFVPRAGKASTRTVAIRFRT